MEAAGLWMLLAVAVVLVATGLPVLMVLIGVAMLFAGFGMLMGAMPGDWLLALPSRVIGLLENDLLQALPLYVLMGAMLDRLPLADTLFRVIAQALRALPSAPRLAALGLGALLAPMNGSVGASVATLTRIVAPKLAARRVPPADGLATVCVASTFGVVVPPSLVLILLGDAMLRAHTEAVNKTRIAVRIINTQDVFRGALAPAALFLVLCLLATWWGSRRDKTALDRPADQVTAGDRVTAVVTVALIVGLLAAVAAGYFYAVEAAATGAFALLLYGIASRSLSRAAMAEILRTTMAITGALFALLVAATTFTLVLRGFGTDRLVDDLVSNLPGGATTTMVVALLALGLCAFVLDAFEIIFVVIPVLMPPLLVRVPDAVWVSVLTLLVLQASFLIPPFGYAVMMARGSAAQRVDSGPVVRALLPYLGVQLVVLALTVALPGLAHLAQPRAANEAPRKLLSDEEVRKRFDSLLPDTPPQEEEPPDILGGKK